MFLEFVIWMACCSNSIPNFDMHKSILISIAFHYHPFYRHWFCDQQSVISYFILHKLQLPVQTKCDCAFRCQCRPVLLSCISAIDLDPITYTNLLCLLLLWLFNQLILISIPTEFLHSFDCRSATEVLLEYNVKRYPYQVITHKKMPSKLTQIYRTSIVYNRTSVGNLVIRCLICNFNGKVRNVQYACTCRIKWIKLD